MGRKPLYWNNPPRAVDGADCTRARIPRKHWYVRIDLIPDICTHKGILERYVDTLLQNIKDGRGLLLRGKYGTGKSGAACAILKASIAHGARSLFLSAPDIQEFVIKDTPFDEDLTMIERAREVHMLVIDDLGAEYSKGAGSFASAETERLVRHRIGAQLPTILTTNLDHEQFAEIYGDGFVEVLKEGVVGIILSGHDWRAQQQTEHKDSLRGK